MSDALDVLGSLADLFWELGQQRTIANQANRTATLEKRVQQLECQLDTTYRLLRELMSRLGKSLGDRQLQDAAAAFGGAEKDLPRATAQGGDVREKQAPRASASEALRCLACGQPMAEDQSKCSSCGWTYAGKEGA
jgi:hypothetical protein